MREDDPSTRAPRKIRVERARAQALLAWGSRVAYAVRSSLPISQERLSPRALLANDLYLANVRCPGDRSV
jgi:hypothetical protein